MKAFKLPYTLLEPVTALQTGQVTVSSSAATPLPTITITPVQGIHLKALKANIGIIYISGKAAANTDYPLNPGDDVFIPLARFDLISFLASVNSDKVAFLVY